MNVSSGSGPVLLPQLEISSIQKMLFTFQCMNLANSRSLEDIAALQCLYLHQQMLVVSSDFGSEMPLQWHSFQECLTYEREMLHPLISETDPRPRLRGVLSCSPSPHAALQCFRLLANTYKHTLTQMLALDIIQPDNPNTPLLNCLSIQYPCAGPDAVIMLLFWHWARSFYDDAKSQTAASLDYSCPLSQPVIIVIKTPVSCSCLVFLTLLFFCSGCWRYCNPHHGAEVPVTCTGV